MALALMLLPLMLTSCGRSASKPSAAATQLVTDPSELVNPFAGTGTGGVSPGSISEFPAADVPFGMIQWGPDTSPDRIAGSGYSYNDTHISGFSLTHLSGTGCAAYGDIPVLPTVGNIGNNPTNATESFSHSHESAAPGRYSVRLGAAGIDVSLAVTTRTGISEITFPKSASANVLFKVAGSANPVTASGVDIVGDNSVTGQVTSGQFCQTGTNYTLYFAASFNRPFESHGTWAGSTVSPGSGHCTGISCGTYVSFDASTDRAVMMKIGISFVSVAGAEANLAAEDPGWSLGRVETSATNQWNSILGRIRIGGGTHTEQRIFYTALYHSLLHPNVISDYNGQYMGDDHLIHRSARPQYSNFSEWDIYRSEIELLSVVAPTQTGDMIQSLVNDAQQNGWLPKWAIADGDASQMNGDSADPIIASAYAFGIHDFDTSAALAAMVKGATQNETGHGLEFERQYLNQYVSQHYVGAGSLDLTSINYSDGASVTLEYAIDDFSIAQLAQELGDNAVYQTMMKRAQNWEYLVNPAAGYIEGRNGDGTFPEGPAFQADLLEPGGELGFEEGNAIQYTWTVPQNLHDLANLLGGNAKVVAELKTFFTHLNAGRDEPYDWSGNEPNLWTPWEFDYFGAPSETQSVVRRIVTTEYHDAPVNEPGNDDLGAMSSWYVWGAIGMYPVTPATANLALASPLFPEVSIQLPSGKTLRLLAPKASATTPYIQSLRVTGLAAPDSSSQAGSGCSQAPATGGDQTTSWQYPWLPSSALTSGATLDFDLSGTPSPTSLSGSSDAPPSYGAGALPAVGFSLPSGGTTLQAGTSGTIELGLQRVSEGSPGATWTAASSGPVTVQPSSGTLNAGSTPASGSSCNSPSPLLQTLHLTADAKGAATVTITLRSATGVLLPPVVVNVTVKDAG